MNCRLIIIEGIMGSGKSRTTQWLTNTLRRQGYKILAVGETCWPHPTRVITDLEKPLAPWLALKACELAQKSLAKWSRFVDDLLESDSIAVFDGQLF
ncbi:hypothetical protein KAI46_07410, partial [bacterium]|nr:hypothetical protein [bacterium]